MSLWYRKPQWGIYLYCAWNNSCTKEPGAGSGDPSGAFCSSTGGWKNRGVYMTNKHNVTPPPAEWKCPSTNKVVQIFVLRIVVYLLRSDIWVNDVVEVFVNPIQQPEEEFLGVMLGVTFKLNGALWHHVLQETRKTASFSQTPHDSTMTVAAPWNIQQVRRWRSAHSKRATEVQVMVRHRPGEAF